MANLWIIFSIWIVPALSHDFRLFHDPPPPQQDQCKDVNASEPIECPNHIGPPCPPCYTNHLPDYVTGDSLNFSTQSKQSINEFMQWYLNWWPVHYPPSKSAKGYDVFAGSAGRAQIYLRLYNYTRNETYLSIANDYIQNALSLLPSTPIYASYMKGNTGVWILASIIEGILGHSAQQTTYLNSLRRTFEAVRHAIMAGNDTAGGIDLTKCGLDEGLSGMLYGALLVNKYYESDIITTDIISNLTFYILDYGIKTGQSLHTNYLQYECPFIQDCYLYGAGHGATGVMNTIYSAYHQYPRELADVFNNRKYYDVLKNTLDFYIRIQLADGNMPTNVEGTCGSVYGNDPDARVQWCHGAPSFVSVFAASAELFADNETAAQIYLHAAVRTGNVIFERGLLVKGTMYCHGIGGNINMLWDLGHKLRHLQQYGSHTWRAKLEAVGYDLEFLMRQSVWRAKQFVLWTLDWRNINRTRIYDSNEAYSMYQGNFALPMTYIQMLSDRWPFDEVVGQPGWGIRL
eukprot:209084_1